MATTSTPHQPRLINRFSTRNFSNDAASFLGIQIFEAWDTQQRGYLIADDIHCFRVKSSPNLDKKFIEALQRVLFYNCELDTDDTAINTLTDNQIGVAIDSIKSNERRIYRDQVIECVAILMNGDVSSKVRLLVQFMDADGNGTISLDELKDYLKVFNQRMLDRLGFSKEKGADYVITYERLLLLFEESDRGMEAISIFSEQILQALKQIVKQAEKEKLLAAHGSAKSSSPFKYLTSSFGSAKKSDVEKEKVQTVTSKPTGSPLASGLRHIRSLVPPISHVNMFKLVLSALQIFMWIYYFEVHRRQDYPIAICVAKGFGLNLRILTLIIYLTMARATMGALYSMKRLRPVIPLGINIEVHSFLGFAMLCHSLGHTFGHIAFRVEYTDGVQTSFTQPSPIIGYSVHYNYTLEGDGYTGFVLLFLILAMAATALLRSWWLPWSYKLFTITHYFYVIWLPFIYLHMPRLWPYFLAITIVMCAEYAYTFYQNTIFTTLVNSRPCGDNANGVTFLSVPRCGMTTYSGSYYRIKIPALSMNEWHPFSLAGSVSSHQLTFFVASVGDWSRELFQLVSDPHRREETIMQVQGPYLAPASQALLRHPNGKILLVASGIGITPFFSVMATKVSDELTYANDRMLYKSLFHEKGDLSLIHKDEATLRQVLRQRYQYKEHHRKLLGEVEKKHQELELNDLYDQKDHKIGDVESGYNEGCKIEDVFGSEGIAATITGTGSSGTAASPLKVIWSIRDVSELMFYLDYVHHLVKSQDDLPFETLSDEQESSMRNLRATQNEKKKRVVVTVEVYLTGLGNHNDPKYMLSQTLFLLSIIDQGSSSYLKIHFGRPNLDDIVQKFSPEEVYYCGGSALKDKLEEVCRKQEIAFYPEDFDSGGGVAQIISNKLKKGWQAIKKAFSPASPAAETTK